MAKIKKYEELAELAYRREIESELNRLKQEIIKWENKEISYKELNQKIQLEHYTKLKNIDKFYGYFNSEMEIIRGIANGILKSADVPKEIMKRLEEKVEMWKRNQMKK